MIKKRVRSKDTFSIGKHRWSVNRYYALFEQDGKTYITTDGEDMEYCHGSIGIDLLETMLDWSVDEFKSVYKIIGKYEDGAYHEDIYEYTYAVFGDNPYIICKDGSKEEILALHSVIRTLGNSREIWFLNNSDIDEYREILRVSFKRDIAFQISQLEEQLGNMSSSVIKTTYTKVD